MRRFLILPLSLFAVIPALHAKPLTLRGYVTAVQSPTSFQLDDYRITDATVDARLRVKPGTLRVGLEVEVKGDYDRNSNELTATEIKAIFDDSDPATPIESMGLVEDKSSLQKTPQGWSGRFVAEGETIVVAPETQISVRHSRAEKKELKSARQEIEDNSSFSPDDVNLDTFAHYIGVRQPDHSILAKRIEFRQDRAAAESGWNSKDTRVVYSDRKSESGYLRIDDKIYRTFPSPEASAYLSQLGTTLIPAHQKELPDKSPGKVNFRFFLINNDAFDVEAKPDGVILVSAHVFDVLENESELAYVLAHEMAKVVEKQAWTTSESTGKQRTEVAAAGLAAFGFPGMALSDVFEDKHIAHRFARSLQGQADRVALDYMLTAGYDPNVAADSWKALERRHAHGHYWGNSEINLWRRTYIESELQLKYAGRDFSTLKRESPDFRAAADAVEAARHRSRNHQN